MSPADAEREWQMAEERQRDKWRRIDEFAKRTGFRRSKVCANHLGVTSARYAGNRIDITNCTLIDHWLVWRLPNTKFNAGLFLTTEPYRWDQLALDEVAALGWTSCEVPPSVHPGFHCPPRTRLFIVAPPRPGPLLAASVVKLIEEAFHGKPQREEAA
jgi:hypothetical protein